MSDEMAGFRKIKAQELSRDKQQKLKMALQRELTEALIRAVKANPPDVDIDSIRLVLKPGQRISEWTVASDCGTCSTCKTCTTCGTCSTQRSLPALPASVTKKMDLKG